MNNEEIFENKSRANSLTRTELNDEIRFENTHRTMRFIDLFSFSLKKKSTDIFSLSSNANVHLCDNCMLSLCVNCRTTYPRPMDSFPNRNGSSSHSIESTDSAFSDQSTLPETLL